MMTLAVTEAPDSHRDPVFWWAQMVREVPTVLTCFFFVGFRTYFVDFVRVSLEFWSSRVFGPREPENRKGSHSLRPPWLRPSK